MIRCADGGCSPLYCIIDTVFLTTLQEVRLPIFVGLILLFGFLTFPARKGDEPGQPHALV